MHSNWYPLKQKDPQYKTTNLVIIHCHGYSYDVNFNNVSPQSSAGKKALDQPDFFSLPILETSNAFGSTSQDKTSQYRQYYPNKNRSM